MKKINAAYAYDALTNTLTVTASFLKKASVLNSAEYRTLLQFRRDIPNLTIVKRESEKKAPANNIKFQEMEGFIAQCRDAETRLAEFERVKKLSKIQASPYKYVKEWFLNNYANYSANPVFDEDGFVIVKTKSELEAEQKAKAESAVSAEKNDSTDEEATTESNEVSLTVVTNEAA